MIKKIKLITLFLICIKTASAFPSNEIIRSVTPFTGADHVKVVVTTGDEWAKTNGKLDVVIRTTDSSAILWKGEVTCEDFMYHGKKYSRFSINKLNPVLWTPTHPFLYEVLLKVAGKDETLFKERLGFRSFESKDGQLYLNGKPIFLRGIAINPPGRGIPEEIGRTRKFAEDYIRYMKSIHVNIIRLQVSDETWYDVCDELGMMTFGGNYGGAVDIKGTPPPRDHYDESVAWLKEQKLGPIAHHPCLMIYAITNETPFRGPLASKWAKFLAYASDQLKQWDNTRTYIANAGYGYGISGDICDIHRYWGWYYASPFTFLKIRDNDSIIPFKKKVQPITFSECVGNYTGPDGRYNLSPNHKNPGSQLNWTGHAPDNLQAYLADEHQSLTFREATELFRRLRVNNRELSGIFPFTILFHNWHTITSFVDMGPKAVTAQARISYSPILLSWECWTPNVYAGNSLRSIVHIVNDDDDFRDLDNARLAYQLTDKSNKIVFGDTLFLPSIKYYDTYQRSLSISVPGALAEGTYELKGEVIDDGKVISQNSYDLYIVNKNDMEKIRHKLFLYDPSGSTEKALATLGVSVTKINTVKELAAGATLIIGENAGDASLSKQALGIKQFVRQGGRILVLKQDSAHLSKVNTVLDQPVKIITMDLETATYPPPPRPSANGYYINSERTAHPLFAGIDRENLKVWSDYTNWDETKTGFPAIHPVSNGFAIGDKNDLSSVAVLADYGPGLEGIAIAEMFSGKGNVLLCGFDLAGRAAFDPVADRLLLNMLRYMTNNEGHILYPMVTSPIIWGDYGSEKGLITGVNSGLIVNGKPKLTGSYQDIPLVITEEGDQFAGHPGGWNDRPGIQYIAYGRRPYGPYELRGLGVPRPADKNSIVGEGSFWCRVPEGTQSVSTLVWNPADKDLIIKIKINDQQAVNQTIKAGEEAEVKALVNASSVHMTFTGDRRLVLLQTSFHF